MTPTATVAYEATPFVIAALVGAFVIGYIAILSSIENSDPVRKWTINVARGVALGGALGVLLVGWPVAAYHRGNVVADGDRATFEATYGVTILETLTKTNFLGNEGVDAHTPDLPRKVGQTKDVRLWVDDEEASCTVYLLSGGYSARCAPAGSEETASLLPAAERATES